MRREKTRDCGNWNGKATRWLLVLLLVAAAVCVASCTGPWVPGNTGPGAVVSPSAVAVPKAPTGVQASDGTYTDKVRVAWTASGGATSYEVWRGTSSSASSSSKIGSPRAATYDDTSAAVGTTYYYWVKAKNSTGASGFSAADTGRRAAPGRDIQVGFDWYRYQGEPGSIQASTACGPASVVMAIQYAKRVQVGIQEVRDFLKDYDTTNRTQLQSALSHWSVPFSTITGATAVVDAINVRGHVVICPVLMSAFTNGLDFEKAGTSPNQNVGRYVKYSGGHFLIAKGMSTDGKYVIVYDPDVFSSSKYWYSTGAPKGKDRYYSLSEFRSALASNGNTAIEITADPSTYPLPSPTLMIEGGTSSQKQQGGMFSLTGTGFTPNTTATRHIIKPNGQDVGQPIQVKPDGTLDIWNYPSSCSDAVGTYDIWVTDSQKGPSNHVSEIIATNPACNPSPSPSLKIDGGTSSQKQQGGMFSLTGTGFTPNMTATRHIIKPNGQDVGQPIQVKPDGTLDIWNYPSSCSDAVGTYDIWVTDSQKGPSNHVSEIIATNPACNPSPSPSLKIDGGTLSQKQQGGMFSLTGTGFTPNTTAARHIIKPNGQDVGQPIQVKPDGTLDIWNYPSSCSDAVGTYDIWVTDSQKGPSNHVSEIIVTNPACAAPTERLSNGSFSLGRANWSFVGDFWAGTNLSSFRSAPGYAAGGVADTGAWKNGASGWMYQLVAIPASATTVTASFWYNITSEETSAIKSDVLSVWIQNSAGTSLLVSLTSLSSVDRTSLGDYRVRTVLLSPSEVALIRGQSVRLLFLATTNASNRTVFRIDDVSLKCDG